MRKPLLVLRQTLPVVLLPLPAVQWPLPVQQHQKHVAARACAAASMPTPVVPRSRTGSQQDRLSHLARGRLSCSPSCPSMQ